MTFFTRSWWYSVFFAESGLSLCGIVWEQRKRPVQKAVSSYSYQRWLWAISWCSTSFLLCCSIVLIVKNLKIEKRYFIYLRVYYYNWTKIIILNCYKLIFQEVGDDSKLAKSFDRLRSLIGKKGFLISRSKETEKKSKLEELVNEYMLQNRTVEKKTSIPNEQRFSGSVQETILFPHDNIYSHSYQESLNRWVNFCHFYISLFHWHFCECKHY